MDQQRASQGPDGSYDLNDSHMFVYKALSKELYVGNVYLRVYNDQPDFEISEPEAFCVALIDFISYLVHNQCARDSDVQNEPKQDGSSLVTSEHPSDMAIGSIDEHPAPAEDFAVSNGQVADKEEFEVVKNLKFALNSLKVSCSLLYVVSQTYNSIHVSDNFFRWFFVELADKQSKFGINFFY